MFDVRNPKTGEVKNGLTAEAVGAYLRENGATFERMDLQESQTSVFKNAMWQEQYIVEHTGAGDMAEALQSIHRSF